MESRWDKTPVIKYFTGLARNRLDADVSEDDFQRFVFVWDGLAYITNRLLFIREPVEMEDQMVQIYQKPLFPSDFRGDKPLEPDFLANHWKTLVGQAGEQWEGVIPKGFEAKDIYDRAQFFRSQEVEFFCDLPDEHEWLFQAVFLADIFRRIPTAWVKVYLPDWSKFDAGPPGDEHGIAGFQWDGGEGNPQKRIAGEALVRVTRMK